MDAKKFMAVFVVLVMALSATACIVCTETDSEAVTLEDQGMVTLDVDKDYAANKTELGKLGLSGSDSWKYVVNGNYKGYQITLKDTVYETSEPIALKIKSTAGNILYIKCEGVNKLVCKGMDKRGYTTCIDAYDKSGNQAGVCFLGPGEFTAECLNEKSQNSVAIYAYLFGAKGCTLYAKTSDIVLSEVPRGDVTSSGICVWNGMMISEGASVYALAGGITSAERTTPQYASSGLTLYNEYTGVTAIIDDSYLCAVGGDLNFANANVAGSIGAYFFGGVEITNSIVEFRSGNMNAEFSGSMTTEALVFDAMFSSEWSYITAISGDIKMESAYAPRGQIFSAGIKNQAVGNVMTMEHTYMIAQAGNLSCEETVGAQMFFSAGMVNATKTEFSVTLKSSIWGAFGGDESEYSYGFVIMDPETMTIASGGSLILDDSEFNATGKTRALAIGSISCVKPDSVKWSGYEKNGKWYEASPAKLTTITDATSVFVGYKSLVYLRASEDEQSEIDVKLVSGDYYELPECGFTSPEGKKFVCWSIDGKSYQPGEKILIDYPYVVVTAVWEDVSSPSSPTGVVVFVVLVALVALAILLMIFVPAKK